MELFTGTSMKTDGRTTEKVVCVARSPYIRIHTGHKAPVLIKLDVVRDSYNSKGRDRCKTYLSSLWDEIWTDANDRAVIRKICAPSSAFALPATYHRAGIQRSGGAASYNLTTNALKIAAKIDLEYFFFGSKKKINTFYYYNLPWYFISVYQSSIHMVLFFFMH